MNDWIKLTPLDVPAFVECVESWPLAIDDGIKDCPLIFMTNRILSPDTYYVQIPPLGYIALDPIFPHDTVIHFFRDPRYRLAKRKYIDKGNDFMVWAFSYFNLTRITLTVVDGAKQAFILAKLLGFQFEGTMRKSRYIDNKPYDVHIFGRLRDG